MAVRVAVVGAGYLGQHHARVFAGLEGVELVGVVDTDMNRAKEIAGKYNARPYCSFTDVLDGIDAVSIVVPTTYHYEVALECLRAGKDVLLEKPITTTLSQADELISEAEKMDCILQVGHLERYNPGFIAIAGMVNKPQLFEAVRQSPFLNRAADVDVTLDLMIHDIDIILSLVSSPLKRIKAVGSSSVTPKIDEAKVLLEFENGAMAWLLAGRTSKQKQRKLRVIEENSCLELDYQQAVVRRYLYSPQDERKTGNELFNFSTEYEQCTGEPVEEVRPEQREPLKEELEDFIRCINNRESPKVSGIEGRNALKVILEINSLIEVALK